MKFETKYGELRLDLTETSIVLTSTFPFKELEEHYELNEIEKAKERFEELKKEILDIIDKLEGKKTVAMTKSTKLYRQLDVAWKSGFRKVLLYGPTGTGKTFGLLSFLNEKLEKGEIDHVEVITLSSGIEDIDLLGRYIVKEDRSLDFIESRLIKAIKLASEGKKVAIVFDEFNRAHSKALNILIPMLDGRNNKVVIDNYVTGELIEAPEDNVRFFLTANFGGGYSGTFKLDDAILNRVEVSIFVDYQNDLEREIVNSIAPDFANKILEFVEFLREMFRTGSLNPVSTRDVKIIANLVSAAGRFDFEVVEPVIMKVVKHDVFGYPDEDTLNEIKQFFEG